MPLVAGKRELCSSNLKYFKSMQGIGNYSIIDRYEALSVIVSKRINSEYHDFLAQPVAESNIVTWYSCKFSETPCPLSSLKDETYDKYITIKEETVAHYNKVIKSLYNSGQDLDAEYLEKAVKYIDDRFIYCFDNKVVLGVWGMQLRENIDEPYGVAVFTMYDIDHFFVKFLAGEHGSVIGKSVLKKESGSRLSEEDVPTVVANEGFSFAGWNLNPVGKLVNNNIQFTATYNIVENIVVKSDKPIIPDIINHDTNKCKVTFNPCEYGTINGNSCFELEKGHVITNSIIPIVLPKKGYAFKGWDVNPNAKTVDKDITFNAVYKKKCTWCKWLLWLLLFMLILFLLILLLRRCERPGCSRRDRLMFSGDTLVSGWFYDDMEPYEPTPTDPRYRDVLPPFEKVLPPVDTTKIIENPKQPGEIISDGLVIINKDDSKSIQDLAVAFTNVYPDYKVVYYNTDTDVMLVQVPENKRETIKAEIHRKIPDFDFYVTELSTVGIGYVPNDSDINNPDINWYFKAVNAFEAWDKTMGSEDIVVAIVDNGFCLNHEELKHRIVLPYNAFEHNGRIYPAPVDHGSHVAGTAIGEMNNRMGVCGIAPKCKFMPIKVADRNGMMHTISILEGVMFAVKHGADVINLSLGMNGLDSIASTQPEYVQRAMIQTMYKEEEYLWKIIDNIAESKGVTIVYAAGNYKALAGVDPQKRSENVIRVSAVQKKDGQYTKAYFSNYGDFSTVSAPGVKIFSCYGENYGVMMNGTSMAAPIVTGAVALMKSLNKNLTTTEIIEILQKTGERIKGDTIMGNLIKIDKALNAVQNIEKEIPSSGDVQIHLEWDSYNDLDLICVDPNGDSVFFKRKKVPSGGMLEIDKNAKRPYTKSAQENIYWPEGKAPNGTYKVMVHYFENHDNDIKDTPYRIMIKHGDKVDNLTGIIKRKEIKHVFTFTMGDD